MAADTVDIVEKIIGSALAIKEAAETAKENEEECLEIERRAARVRDVVSRLSESAEVMKDTMLPGALGDLEDALQRAHAAVVACRRRRTSVCRLYTAGTLSKRLHKVHEDIMRNMIQTVFVINAAIFIPAMDEHTAQSVERLIPMDPPSPSPSSKDHPPPPPSTRPSRLFPHRPKPEKRKQAQDVQVQKVPHLSPRHSVYSLRPAARPTARPAARPAASREDEINRRAEEFIKQRKRWFHKEFGGHQASAGSMPRYEADDRGKKVPARTEVPSLLFPKLTVFSLSELEAATDGFSAGNIIGRGVSGSIIFKGVLHETLVVAVKKFQDPPKSLVARIHNELHISSELQHDEKVKDNHIIRTLGYGHEVMQKHHILVVKEYMANGNMAGIIYGSQHDWSSRFTIIQGIAHGVNYLHEQEILHLDLKPSNVLLDSNMNPKITGLGRARKLSITITRDDSIAGTIGYMPPEYILEGTLGAKYDVYSFGVILLETISGMCRPEPARHQASVEWAWEAHERGQMGELLDPSLCLKDQLVEVGRCMEIGLLCAQEKPTDRPAMVDVLRMLNGEKETTTPTRPEYTTKRRPRPPRRDGAFNLCFRVSDI